MNQAEIIKRLREEYDIENGLKEPKKEDLLTITKKIHQRVIDLLTIHKVPYSNADDEDTYEDYLFSDDDESGTKKSKKQKKLGKVKNQDSDDEDVDARIASIKNKLRQKKGPTTERQQKRRESKKLKRSKGVQKLLLSSAKNLKNEAVKHQKLKNGVVKTEQDPEDSKEQIQPVKVKPVYNQEAKIVYSKVDFAANPGTKAKKSHQNPKEILKKLRDTKKHLTELREQGETDKAAEMQTDIAWRKAFDKVEGKKVKDDTKLLQKSIKKRRVEKKKSKTKWTERKQKVEYDKEKRQKKRQENLDKRSKDKKNRKLKTASKKGRIIPGF
ncbi:LOW QUALITY PROTEIN: surfeit locus protein 6 homolog [Drosophila eugracilis]|uniref:LOW QUALITY PROTEIN: surfeit locus protein 6 homolog n=1 Tax=Drosophila eugracilis TaxID=29029 RepID=UPI001BD93915|nr:LOW QUALITY PROTEIN: surfeit locus protein 6 homolog [Drosophila eugracilis]